MFQNKSVRPMCSVVYPEGFCQDPGLTFQAVPDPILPIKPGQLKNRQILMQIMRLLQQVIVYKAF
jgi:hypothetical protein